MNLTHISLCSGIGGIDLAAVWAGFTTIAQCEIDPYASKVLAKNFKGVFNYGDIRAITNDSLTARGIFSGCITVLSAGFPCQPYSLAGKGKGNCDERDLWDEVKRCIGIIKPKWFVGENTPGLFARANQKYFKRILTDLAEMGYTVSWGIWGAADVGAWHKRDRVFIICRNSDLHGNKTEQAISKQNTELTGVYRKVPNAACQRFDKNEIQRRKLAESGDKANGRQIQGSRVQSGGICCGIPDTSSKRYVLQKEQIQSGRYSSKLCDWWQVEPDVGRVANGVSSRVDRLRCLGNAVVPQQIYPVFKAIAED